MPRKLTSAKARMWAGYNRRRAKDRAADAARRRERAAQREAEYVDAFMPGKAPNLGRKRHGFRVTVECLDDGARVSLLTLRTPFGLTIPPTLVGKKVACVLREYKPINSSYRQETTIDAAKAA